MSKYKYKNKEDYRIYVPELSGTIFTSAYLTCNLGEVIIKEGYCWDGCTIVPDTKRTYLASLIHDALYQYGRQLGLKQIVADRWFLQQLLYDKFQLSRTYYLGVRIFGWLWY